MARQPHVVDVDVEQKRREDAPYFPTSCSCGAWLRTHTSRADALQAFFLHLREPGAFGPRRPREDNPEGESPSGGFVSAVGEVPEAAGVGPGMRYVPRRQ